MRNFKFEDYDTFVFDLDGTLLSTGDDMHMQHRVLVASLISRGKKVIVATGRHGNFTHHIYNRLKLDTPLISLDGALLTLPNEDRVLYVKYFDRKVVKDLFTLAKKFNLEVIANTEKDEYYFQNGSRHYESKINRHVANNTSELYESHYLKTSDLDNFYEQSVDVAKINFAFSHLDKYEVMRLRSLLDNVLKIPYWDYSDYGVFEFLSPGSSKGYGLKILEKQGYLRLKRTIAFGNAVNDDSMADFANVFVAVANAEVTTKRVAAEVTDYSNREAGIERFIDRRFR